MLALPMLERLAPLKVSNEKKKKDKIGMTDSVCNCKSLTTGSLPEQWQTTEFFSDKILKRVKIKIPLIKHHSHFFLPKSRVGLLRQRLLKATSKYIKYKYRTILSPATHPLPTSSPPPLQQLLSLSLSQSLSRNGSGTDSSGNGKSPSGYHRSRRRRVPHQVKPLPLVFQSPSLLISIDLTQEESQISSSSSKSTPFFMDSSTGFRIILCCFLVFYSNEFLDLSRIHVN